MNMKKRIIAFVGAAAILCTGLFTAFAEGKTASTDEMDFGSVQWTEPAEDKAEKKPAAKKAAKASKNAETKMVTLNFYDEDQGKQIKEARHGHPELLR